jgi:hypothetical protein
VTPPGTAGRDRHGAVHRSLGGNVLLTYDTETLTLDRAGGDAGRAAE